MKLTKYILLALFAFGMSIHADAKKIQAKHLYIFGFSASFQDSLVFFTDIQDVPGAWMDSKTKFLLGRDSYSYQLKSYFDNAGLNDRVCMVVFDTNKKKAERKYLKMKKQYTTSLKKKRKKVKVHGTYDVQYIPQQAFKFEVVDMSD